MDGASPVVGAFTLDLVEGKSTLLSGGLPFDEETGHFAQHTPDPAAGG